MITVYLFGFYSLTVSTTIIDKRFKWNFTQGNESLKIIIRGGDSI